MELRRNPKRKAAEPAAVKNEAKSSTKTKTASASANETEDLLKEALKPLTKEELNTWTSWIELESEPAFFNGILRELGVQDAKAYEVFGIDQDFTNALPRPIHGLIFLFQVSSNDDEEVPDPEPDAEKLWFANQTTKNACATVALMNIIMNANVVLSDKLQEFATHTANMTTPCRGEYLGRESTVRAIHNSFSRRLDHLNADLGLEQEACDHANEKKKKKKRMMKKSIRVQSELSYHFIAYLPAKGYVWELDGLRQSPIKLGPSNTGDWIDVARPHIQTRMMRNEETQISFSLLAVCTTGLVAIRHAIANNLASLLHLHTLLQAGSDNTDLPPLPLDVDDPLQLAEFQLIKSDVQAFDVSSSLKNQSLEADSHAGADLRQKHEDVTSRLKMLMSEYRTESMSIQEDEELIRRRTKDYGPAVHVWLSKLVQKGVLEDMVASST